MQAPNRNRMRISLLFPIIISLALLGCWALNNIGMLAAIALHHHNLSEPEPHINKVSMAPTSYTPNHYLFFNGNGSYGLIPASRNLNVSQFSIAFWTRSDGPNHRSFDRPIETLQWIKNSSGIRIPYGWTFDSGDQSTIGIEKLRFTVGSTSGNLFITNDVTVPRSSWTHIAGTFDGKALKLYQNGALVNAFPFRGSYSYHITPLPVQLAIGWLPHHYWTGDLSDIRIYGRALSQFEINSIFHGQNISNGLIGWWKLNEGTGISIADSSRFRNNGTIHNVIWRSTPGSQSQLSQCNVIGQLNCLPLLKKITIGIVKPTFTAAAYNNAFYSWYGLAQADEVNGKIDATRCYLSSLKPFSDPCETLVPLVSDQKIAHFIIGSIPHSTDSYNQTTPAGIVTSRTFGAYDVLKIVPHLREVLRNISSIQVITDGDVNDAPTGAALNKAYDILILGHQEYVTQKEYDNLKNFVANGGTLVCLDGNLFYAQVTYNKANQTVMFVKGHGYYFDGKNGWDAWAKAESLPISAAFERWRNETSQWLGSNYYMAPHALVPSPNASNNFQETSLDFANNPFGYFKHEEQYITNPQVKILIDYGAVATMPQGGLIDSIDGGLPHPVIATYEKNYGKGNIIVFGIYADEVLSNPEFLWVFDNILSEYRTLPLQEQPAVYVQNEVKYAANLSWSRNSSLVTDSIEKGNALTQAGDYGGAIKYYNKALAVQPNSIGLLINYGNALSAIGNYTGAIKYYDKALATLPYSTFSRSILINKASGLVQLGKYEDAIRLYNNVLTTLPNSTGLLIGKAQALFELGNYTGAIKYYDKALVASPDNSIGILNGKAHALFELGNYTGAIKYYDKALKIAPISTSAREGKMMALRELYNNTNIRK